MNDKADAADFTGRFREVVSDPLNLLIERVPDAGTVENGNVVLHNGLRVARSGPKAYYDRFSDILAINRGVHEPLEEYAFQEVLKRLAGTPAMLELGAYWGHYSMWLKHRMPAARVHLVEPDADNLDVGRHNFEVNGITGTFEQDFVGTGRFKVDTWLAGAGIDRLTILHSDIQGYEGQMLDGAEATLITGRVDYVFVSTHGQVLHHSIVDRLSRLGYRIEVAADYLNETTSYDGFVLASHPGLIPVFPNWSPLGRRAIARAGPADLVASLLPRLGSLPQA